MLTYFLFFFFFFFFRSFDPRKECILRKYSYLLPTDVIGIESNFTTDEIDFHISDFNEILNTFEVRCILLFDSFSSFPKPSFL